MAIKFNLESYEYDVLKHMKSEVKALRAEYSRLRSIARKRLERLGSSAFKDSQTYLRYRNTFKSLDKIKIGNISQLSKKLNEVHTFLNLKTSTVTGQKAVSMERIKQLQMQGYTFIKTPQDLKRFGQFMDYNRSLKKGGLYDSEKVIEMLDATSEKGMNQSQVEKDFRFWMDNYEILDEIPAASGKWSVGQWKKAIEAGKEAVKSNGSNVMDLVQAVMDLLR